MQNIRSNTDRSIQNGAEHYRYWEKIKDCIDQYIDIMLNYRQSGHPGGSRSKVHAFVALLLSGSMRWDIRHPDKRFNDRFVLVAGHTIPLLYATFPVLNEALRYKHEQTRDSSYLIEGGADRAVYWQDLPNLRKHSGLPGHAEMEGKTLFLKANTGPSGHGSPFAVGQAMALKRAGVEDVRVFAMEGEGGLTTGATHETLNSAYGLGLSNLCYLIDWNDFGIDSRPFSDVVYGTPEDWFRSHGWRHIESEDGSQWENVTSALLELVHGDNPDGKPGAVSFKTRKGREYLKYDHLSHGAAHAMNSDLFWKTKQPFMERYGVAFEGYGNPAPDDGEAAQKQALANLGIVADVIRSDQGLVDYIADRLVELGESVPRDISTFRLNVKQNPSSDKRLTDIHNYPSSMFAKPGDKVPNRAGLAKFGAWVNTWCQREYGRPLFIAMSADLADSTNISGFAKDFGEDKGLGWFNRESNPEGVLLPQGITEFTNAGITAGLATVNFNEDPYESFNGFYGTCSTYGSFSYLKYGLFRLFSQLAQDSQIKVGKALWIAGHSGPETAEDSRTHFGIFAPGVTQLFPDGHVIDLHPWEHNEVAVTIGAALKTDAPLIALHLTRPAVEIPDREALGMDSHLEAAKGAYLIRPYRDDQPRMGTVVVQGTSSTNNLVKILGRLDNENINVKIVAAVSPQLYALQDVSYRDRVYPDHERLDAMAVTNRSRRLMTDWIDPGISADYSLCSDWDNRWRTGGTVDEVLEEAHLSPDWIMEGIRRFAGDRVQRLERIRGKLDRLERT